MTITTTSELARLNWRDTIDQAFRGSEVVIERHGKPTVVVVSYDHWQQMRRLWLDLLDQRSAEIKAGDYLTQEEFEAQLAEGEPA